MKSLKLYQIHFILAISLIGMLIIQPGSCTAQSLDEIMNDAFKKAKTIEDYQQFVEDYQPNELAFVAVLRLAQPFLDQKDWQGAIGLFQSYRNYFPFMAERFDKIIALLAEPSHDLTIKNPGTGVNTKDGEYCPVITADNKKLYFVRMRQKLVFIDDQLKYKKDEDIYVSTFQSKGDSGFWSAAEYLGEPICTSSPEAPLGISADGNTLVLYGNYSGSLGRGDIFYTEKTVDGWSSVQHYPSPINSEYFDCDAMIAADGKAILFVSERPGGMGKYVPKDNEFYHGWYGGNTDIYVSIKSDTGWVEPINLGKIINTPYCERMPFLHPDGKTLYFSSDGHYGLGNLDVFKATRLSDTSWTEWSDPINLGKDFNSFHTDWCYRISTSGDVAYFSAFDRNTGNGDLDIYSIDLPQDTTIRPLAVTTVSGRVMDPSGNPLSVDIKWNDLTLNKQAGEARSDPKTGKYFIALPAGHQYGYYAEKEGYIGKSEYLDLRDKEQYTEYSLDIVLYPVEIAKKEGIIFELKNIFFDFDKYDLREESFYELNRWLDLLMKNSKLSAEIYGHTDDKGTDTYNQILSERRARSVVSYLVSKGISKDRLTSRGLGKRKPIDLNGTEEGRRKNRRVEIRLVEKPGLTEVAEKIKN